MASNRVVVGEAPVLTKIAPVSNGTKPVSSQANILSAAIKRKAWVSFYFPHLSKF